MTTIQRFYRVRIRNAADSGDTLVLSSVPLGTNPYIAAPPHGDGEEIDVITGAVRHGAYTVLAVDPAAPGRPITSILADASGFWQPLGRKAFIETSTDGSAWSPRTAGYVQAVRFPSAIEAEFTIGDAQRIDLTREVFAKATTEFPGATALVGGPCVGGTGPFKDNGAWRMRVVDATAGPPGDVGLAFVRGFIPSPDGYVKATSLSVFAHDYINSRALEYAVPSLVSFRFPGLIARTVPAGGGSTLFHTPYARAPLFTLGKNLISPQLLLTLSWNGTLPSVNDEFDVYVFPETISEVNPLHVQGHPIDILTDLWTEAGIAYDTTLAASTKTAIGADAWLDLRFTAGLVLADFARDVILGPWGVGWRTGSDGERELFTTRKRSASNPATTITTSHLLVNDPESQPILFELDEASIVDAVTHRERRFQFWTPDLEGERPADDVVSSENAITVLLDGVTAPKHEVEYSIPGSLRVGSGGFDAFADANSQDILTRFGFGCPSTEIRVTEAQADPLGNEVTLDVAHQINGNTRGGSRNLQIVRRTPEADGGVSLKVLDSGVTSQIGTAPTLTLAAIGKNGVEVTVTNFATIAAAGWNIRLEWGFGGSQPSEGALLKVLLSTDASGVFDTPQVDSGARVWVRARSERYDRRPSAFSSWSDVNLTDLVAPSSLSRSVNTLSWTVGESDRLIKCRVEYSSLIQEVALLPAGSTSFDFTPFVIPSTSTTLRVSHVDELPFLGASTEATLNYTTAAGSSLPTPVAFTVGVGSILDGERNWGSLYPEATATQFPSITEFDVAVETSVGSGTYGSFTTFARVPSVVGGPTKAELRNLPKDGKNRRFRCRLIGPSFSASSYTSNVDVIPWSAITRPPVVRRNLRITDDAGGASPFIAYAARAENTTGTTLPSATVQTDGVALRSIAKGHTGGEHRHNVAITFPAVFQNVPLVVFGPGGIGDEPRSRFGTLAEVNADDGSANDAPSTSIPQYDIVAADDLDASGFTMVALKMQKGTPVAQFDNFAGTDLDVAGETDTVTLNGNTVGAPSFDNKYVVRFGADADITAGPTEDAALHVQIAIETNADGAGWVERRVVDFFCTADTGASGGNTTNYVEEITVSGLDDTDQLRLIIKSIELAGAGAVLDQLAVTGRTDNTGVTFNTDSGVKYANKTPDSGDTIPWEALAVA